MITPPFKIPFYARAALIFIALFALVFVLYTAKQIIIPIVFATIVAILLNPLVNFLTRHKINRVLAISLAVVVALLAFAGALYIVSSQVTMFSETYPQLKVKLDLTRAELVHWCSEKFNARESDINAWIKASENEAIHNFAIGEKLSAIGRFMISGMLFPVYLFMILFYKAHLLEFIRRLFRSEHHLVVEEVLERTKKIIQSYVVGLFFEMIIIAALNTSALLLLGIDYAVILGITGAILNIIPYIGGIIAVALPMLVAYVTKDSPLSPILVMLVYLIIQFVDNHYIIPKIVASRVKINALVSVIVVLIGAAVWGVPGMFLSIPLTAILKVIFDNIDPLKPWGFLLGNIVPTVSRPLFVKKKKPAQDGL
jgi:predicted PurR-regulated permease PerM